MEKSKIFVTTIPKAGTYLIPEILKPMGYKFTRLHIGVHGGKDYSQCSIEEASRDKGKRIDKPCEQVFKQTKSGQIIVGHLPCIPRTKKALNNWKVIFCYRDFRDALVSHMRWLITTKRHFKRTKNWCNLPPNERFIGFLHDWGDFHVRITNSVLPWFHEPMAMNVKFETLMGDEGPKQAELIRNIAEFVNTPLVSPTDIISEALGTKTITSSGNRSNRTAYWSKEAEKLFSTIGGIKINEYLGY